jgi:membrane protein DedA with SNARE-associated domain
VGASVVVIAAGAFSQQGFLDWLQAAAIGLAGAVLGDAISFGMGYFAKDWTQRRFGNSTLWVNARDSFQKQGGLAVFLTRWLVTAVAIPTNLIAGGSGYKFSRFIAYDITGEIVWIIIYGGLGYAFGSEWEIISEFLSNFGGLILGLVVFGFGIRQVLIWQRQSKVNVYKNAEA